MRTDDITMILAFIDGTEVADAGETALAEESVTAGRRGSRRRATCHVQLRVCAVSTL